MADNCYRFHDLFDQLGLPSSAPDIAQFLQAHRPLPGTMLLVDAPFWDAAQAQFLREKKATDDPVWVPLIDQLSEALRDDAPVAAGPRLLGISGSLRRDSFNTRLLHAAARTLAPGGSQLDVATLHGIPLYDGDAEARDGLPTAVLTLRERIRAADAVVLATPEYNNGIPGVFKNAIDWVSRVSPQHADVLKGKPVAVLGASPGGFGTLSAQAHWLPVLRMLGMPLWVDGRLMVSRAHTVLTDDGGTLHDAALQTQLADFMQGFAAFVARQRSQLLR